MEVMDRKAFKYAWKALILQAIPIREAHGITKQIEKQWYMIQLSGTSLDRIIHFVSCQYHTQKANEQRMANIRSAMSAMQRLSQMSVYKPTKSKPKNEKFYDAHYKKNKKGYKK